MSKLAKKVFTVATVAILAVGVAMPMPASAQSVEELQAQINALLETIAQLQAQLQGATPGAGIAGIPAGFTFNMNMSQGMSHNDVRYLQMALNSDADTRVAASGAGSPGSETMHFGPLTRMAVVKFQQKHAAEVLAPVGLTSGTGFVGPSTRAKLNAMLAAAPTPTPTPTPDPSEPTPTPTPTPEPGMEGDLTSTRLAVPSAVELGKGQSKSVMGVELEAKDSSINVQRVDVSLERTTGTADQRPWRTFDRVQLIVDGDVVTSRALSSSADFTQATNIYTVRVSGFNFNIPADSEVDMEIAFRVRADIADANLDQTWTVSLASDAVRGVDGVGIHQTTGDHNRTFDVVSDAAELEVVANTGTPDERIVQVSKTSVTQNVRLLTFDLENDGTSDVTVEDLIVELVSTDTDNDRVDDIVSVARLLHGSTVLGTVNITHTGNDEADAAFNDINLVVPADSSVTLHVEVNAKGVTGNYSEGATLMAQVDGERINAIHGDEEVLDMTGAATVEGNDQHLYSVAPQMAFTNASLTKSADDEEANGSMTFTVTAIGGPIFIDKRTPNGSAGIVVEESEAAINGTYLVEATGGVTTSASGDNWRIASGSTATFTVTIFLAAPAGSSPFVNSEFVHVFVDDIEWATTDVTTYNGVPDSLLEDFRTGNVLLRWD